jgi:tetratricopeptide (TPR) repeat protein
MPACAALMGIIVAGYSAASRHRTYIWGDDIRLWEDASEKAPGKARPHYNLGVAYLPTNKEKARNAFLRVIALRPGHAPALYNLGWIEQSSGRQDAARDYYRVAIQADPAHWQAHQNLGNIHFVQGNVAEAIREFQETIRLRAEYWPAYQSLATLLIQQKRYEDAAETLTRLKQLRPDLAEGYYLMAYALVQEGRVSEAEQELRVLSVTDWKDEFKDRIDELRRTISSRHN